jgi:hypothetical protein
MTNEQNDQWTNDQWTKYQWTNDQWTTWPMDKMTNKQMTHKQNNQLAKWPIDKMTTRQDDHATTKQNAIKLTCKQNDISPKWPIIGNDLATSSCQETKTTREYWRGKYHSTIDLLSDLLGLVYFADKNKNCQLSYSWFQTSQTGGQWYSDTSKFSIPWTTLQAEIIRFDKWNVEFFASVIPKNMKINN